MQKSNTSTSDIPQTEIKDAYKYDSFSKYINSTEFKQSKFSPICIFCSFHDSVPLMDDGSFRSCKKCKRNFKAKFF